LAVVSNPKTIYMSEKSAFRPRGRDVVEFFNSTGWAFHFQVAALMRLPADSRVMGNPVEGERDSGLKPNTIPL
jgi:hypothetical protein